MNEIIYRKTSLLPKVLLSELVSLLMKRMYIFQLYINPMKGDSNFAQEDLDKLFINWSDVISCSSKLVQ